jgi:hypothetical protein
MLTLQITQGVIIMSTEGIALPIVELAFAMARSGRYRDVKEISIGLVEAGHSRDRIRRYLTGSVAWQLTRICGGKDSTLQFRRRRLKGRRRIDRGQAIAPMWNKHRAVRTGVDGD